MSMAKSNSRPDRQALHGCTAQNLGHFQVLEDIRASLRRMEKKLTQGQTSDDQDHVEQLGSDQRDGNHSPYILSPESGDMFRE
jgi:hypothetical protein